MFCYYWCPVKISFLSYSYLMVPRWSRSGPKKNRTLASELQDGRSPTGRSFHSLQDAALRLLQDGQSPTGGCACYRGLIVGLVFLFPSDIGFVGYYLFRCFYILLCEISPLQGCFVLYLIVS